MKEQEIPEVQVKDQLQEQIVPDRIEEQIRDIPVHPIAEVVQVILNERLQQRIFEHTVNTPVPQIVAVTSERMRKRTAKPIVHTSIPLPPFAKGNGAQQGVMRIRKSPPCNEVNQEQNDKKARF